jgi:hypothetical protein
MQDPQSLHKYLYVHGDPVNSADPTGEFSFGGLGIAMAIGGIVGGLSAALTGGNVWHGIAYGALGGAIAFVAFPIFAAMFGAGTSLVGFYAALAATGFTGGSITGGLQSYLAGNSALDVIFDALESGILGAAVSIFFGPFFSGKYVAKPGQVTTANFAQSRINASEEFSEEGVKILSKIAGRAIKTVDDLVAALDDGTLSAKDVPVDYVIKDGVKLILNTRTSTALSRANIPRAKWYSRDVSGAKVPGLGKTTFDDLAAEQLRRNKLPSTGTPNPPQ